MNAIWVRRFVDVLVAMFALVILGSLIQLVGSIMGDTFGTGRQCGVPDKRSSILVLRNIEFT